MYHKISGDGRTLPGWPLIDTELKMRYNKSMVKKTIFWIVAITSLVLLGSAIFGSDAMAQVGAGGAISGINSARGDGVPDNLASGDDSIIRRVINLMLYAVGVISVIMLIYGGFRYVISGGQKESVTAAKNTILYAIVGLIISIFAYAIVKFVISAVVGTDSVTDI